MFFIGICKSSQKDWLWHCRSFGFPFKENCLNIWSAKCLLQIGFVFAFRHSLEKWGHVFDRTYWSIIILANYQSTIETVRSDSDKNIISEFSMKWTANINQWKWFCLVSVENSLLLQPNFVAHCWIQVAKRTVTKASHSARDILSLISSSFLFVHFVFIAVYFVFIVSEST